MSVTISNGLTITIPSEGDDNWSSSIQSQCFEDISAHDHTGSGNGVLIGTDAIANLAVTNGKLAAGVAGVLGSNIALISQVQSGAANAAFGSSGSANTQTFAFNPVIASQSYPLTLKVIPSFTNTGALSVDVGAGSFSVKVLRNDGYSALTGGEFRSGYTYYISAINGSTDLLLLNPSTEWQSYVATPTGFSANPSIFLTRYIVIGNQCTLAFRTNTGTSNATTFSFTLPITAKTITSMIWTSSLQSLTDNSVAATVPGLIQLSSGGTSVSLFTTARGDVWTASGTKGAAGQITYEI